MNVVFGAEGWRRLRASWLLLAGALAAGAAIVYASLWYVAKENRDSQTLARGLQEARARVEASRRERDSLNQSADVFRVLVERGLLQSERRLDLVELVNNLRTRHRLFTLDYEISPQRVLPLAGNRVFPSIDVLASRVKLKARALHEGDVLGFMGELAQTRQGFYPVDQCAMHRLEAPAATLQPHVEAECTLEWITLRDKHVNRQS